MKRKEQYADEIIEMLERTKCGAWASNINLNTKDRVIEVCQNVVDDWSGRKFKDHCTTLPQALEQEPCEDAISRQATIDAINKIHPVDTEYDCTLYDKLDVMYMLKNLPPITPQPKKGHWIRMKAYEKWGCSECHTVFRFTFKEHDYCPNCGARMVEP